MGLLDDLGSIFGAGAAGGSAFPVNLSDGTTLPGGGAAQSLSSLPLSGTAPSQGMGLAGTIMGGLGRSLMTSPSNNPLQGFSAGLQAASKANGLSPSQDALIQRLKAAGLSEEQARMVAANPSMAQSLFGNISMTGPGGEPVPTLPPLMPPKLGINS